ncbi:MAG: type I-B CRISPR-associated protein Cas5b [Candidatus Altarchaeum sp.]|nr:type I-B CRISPR-associated protein Cas5b [Candidatus Altarchaeum sp.]
MDEKQNIRKVLVFDVWGDYAHFRRGYTTTSPLTFSIPPRTALCGLIGAILGLEKKDEEYLRYFTLDQAKIGLKLLNNIKKVLIAENLIHTKDAKGIGMNLIETRTQIRFEFLKDPKYRIYFWHSNNEIYNQLKKNLIEHKSVYTPCFGLSENIANFNFVGEIDVEIKEPNEKILIYSVLPTEKATDKEGINFDFSGEYFSLRLPTEMNQERIITKYSNILFERNGKPIEANMKTSYWEITDENGTKQNIVFIE